MPLRARAPPALAGKGQRAAKTEIEKAKFEDKTCEEALGLVAKVRSAASSSPRPLPRFSHLSRVILAPPPTPTLQIILSGRDDAKDKPCEVELGWVAENTGFKYEQVPVERRDAAVAWAKAQIEAEEQGDDDEGEGDAPPA
jgi:hypothetical protein